MYINRYKQFLNSDGIEYIPSLSITTSDSDESKLWNKSSDRLDKLSQTYYGHPFGGWLIMLANKNLGSDEFDFENGDLIIIPFPYQNAIQRYENAVKKYNTLY